MPDHGARYTDKQIAELERRISGIFETAYHDTRQKYLSFMKKFLDEDKVYRRKLKAGEITKETYDGWMRGQVFQKKRWKAQCDELARTMTNTTKAAMGIINDAAPGVFTMNANYASYAIERAGNIDMGFDLYDEDAVRRLARDNPNLLPPSRVDILREQAWNIKLITRQIGVGIVTGEGIMAIADRLRNVARMSKNQSLTHARTAMTGAQNAGRIESYHRAEKLGIKLEKEWLATLDGHTRRSHAELDGQHVPVDEPFQSILGEIMYPGDPSAHPANVYNCRCTLISHLLDYPSKNAKRRPNLQQLGDRDVQKPIKDMTFAQWEKWKKAASASPRFVNKMDELFKNAQKVKRIAGYEDVVVHGDKYGFAFKDANGVESNVSVLEFAQILRESPDYHGGAIRLLSCETGAEDGFAAQQLANAMGVEVMAPSDTLFVWPDGEMTIGSDPLTNDGKWIIFKPKK